MFSKSLGQVAPKVGRVLPRRALSAVTDYPAYVLNAPTTDVSTLSNGLRVASETGFGETATVGVYIDAGSRYETAETNGAAHFLEHMAFKGSSKRAKSQLELEIENMGGHLNAYTSREQTVYYAKVFKKDVPKALDILSDILIRPNLDQSAIENERDVILREYQEVNKIPEEVIFDHLHETAYQGTGLGYTILGPQENIRRLTKKNLQDYISTHYTAPRMVVAGAGAVDHSQLVELSSKLFGSLPSESPKEVKMDAAVFTGSDYRIRMDDDPVAHLAIAFESAGWTSPHAFPIMVMQTLIGSWDRTSTAGKNGASKLAQAVSENELAHSFHTFNTCYKDTGLFGVYAVAEKTELQELTWNIMYTMVRLCHNVSDEEVDRAKVQLKANLLMMLDGSTGICEDIGRQMLTYNRRIPVAELFARIDAVDVDAVRAAANEIINDQEHVCAATGPILELPDYNWMRNRTFWLRY